MEGFKNYFTSDWHLGENRIGIDGALDLFFRPFETVEEQDGFILEQFEKVGFRDGDKLYHLGDVFYNATEFNIELLTKIRNKYPNSCFHLIIGNYDEDKLDFLSKFFDTVMDSFVMKIGNEIVYLNHYPCECLKTNCNYSITGHIHGLWRVQKDMINVGVDAWHFRLLSEDDILFYRNAMINHYDNNVFPY